MILSYDYFVEKLNSKIKTDDSFYYELLCTVIKNPHRYVGIFRLTNAKTKLIQNVTQSREIKLGDFMEDIVTDYIHAMGYTNLNKHIGTDTEGNQLNADQAFREDNTIYLIEQKIRDDHDSTKKRGQYDNFRKKYTLLKKQYPDCTINATMWFIDDSLVKNKNFYTIEASQNTLSNVTLNILYGGALFDTIFKRNDVWQEICQYLEKHKQERSDEILHIPDFDTSPEMLNALKQLKINDPNLYQKLMSDKPLYVQLRKELFPTSTNLKLL